MTSNDPQPNSSRYLWMGVICAVLTFGVIAILHTTAFSTSSNLDALVISAASLLLFFPLLRITRPDSQFGLYQFAYTRTLIGLLTLAAIVMLFRYLPISRNAIGGVDWYYYLCYSRDMVNSYPVSDNLYSYFPGVYVFWTTVMRLFGTDLETLQTSYQIASLLVCLLTGWIVKQHSHSRMLAGLTAVWTFVLITKFDGLTGVTELLAVIPWLIGLAIWKGKKLDQQLPLPRILLLGIMLGWTVFTKQQAGLLCLGFLFLLYEQRTKTHSWRRMILLPGTALCTLLLSTLIFGDGLRPLAIGLQTAASYGAEQSWIQNLYTQFRHDESLWLSLAVASILFLNRQHWLTPSQPDNHPTLRLIGFLLVASLASLIQFRSRPFHHYMLLCIPAIVLTCTLVYDRYQFWLQESRGKRILVGSLIVLPSIWCAPYNDSFHPLRLEVPQVSQWTRHQPLHQQAALSQIVTVLDKHIPTESKLLILPGRYNLVHYQLESFSDRQTGYNFRTRQFASAEQWSLPLESTDAEFVVLLTGAILTSEETALWTPERLQLAKEILTGRGYRSIPEALKPGDGLLFRNE